MLSQSQVDSFDANGYLVLENAIPQDLVQRLRSAADAMAAEEADLRTRVWHERALFRRPVFREVLTTMPLIEGAESLLGPDIQLLALDLVVARPGSEGIGWHRDVSFACSKTLSINTGIYLQDTRLVGPLRVVPGSHRWESGPEGDPGPDAIEVPARAGDAVFFDAALWHAGNRNPSELDRVGLFAYFGHYWIKRMDNHFTQPLPASLQESDNPQTRQLLGLGLRPGVAAYHGDDEGYNRRGEAGIDFA